MKNFSQRQDCRRIVYKFDADKLVQIVDIHIGLMRELHDEQSGWVGKSCQKWPQRSQRPSSAESRGTREAELVATEIIARFHKATKGLGKSRNPPMYLAAVLFDLEKAFDKVDTPTAFAALSAKAQMAGLDVYLEEMQKGT